MVKSLRSILFLPLVLVVTLGYGQAPAITSFSPSTGPVGTLVTINGTNLSTPTTFTIGGKSAIVVSNTGSVLVGMVMPNAVTGVVSITTAGGTANGTGSFTVTATKYPSIQQGSKLVGTGNVGTNVAQGLSVSLSADGNTAIVGGTGDNTGVGAAWIYTRSGGTWTQQGPKLVGTGSVGQAEQGFSVALSADGNTAIVGGIFDNSNQGAAWIYTRSGSTWSQQGLKLVGTGGAGTQVEQGSSVALSADGNTAMVGGSGDDVSGGGAIGAVWVYTRKNGAWTQQGPKLVGTGSTEDFVGQGISVSLSADGNTAIVGGPEDNDNLGAVWIYTRTGETWTQQGPKLVGTGGSSDGAQGKSVSLSADGNTALIGATNDNALVGAAWVFIRSAGAWTQQGAKLVGTGVSGLALQGASVSLSADGNTAIVGGNRDNSFQGAAWVYTRSGSTWAQQGTKLVGKGNTGAAQQGISVAVSADGNTAFVGGSEDNSIRGAAWVYAVANPPAVQASNVIFTNTSAISTTAGWTNGSGEARAVFMAKASAGSPLPVDVTSYTANASFGSGTQIGTSGWYCVYNGSGSSVNITGLAAVTTYRVMTVEYNGTTGFPQYLTAAGTGNPNNVTTLSNNALLSSIKLTPASTLTNTGTTGTTTTYTTTASGAAASVTVTATTQDPTATVKVNGVPVSSGTASGPIALAFGQNTITTVVTAQDGTTTHTYSITITRLLNNASLSIIKLTPASALTNTGTTGTTTTYTTSANSATTSVTVTPTAQDPTATIKVNGTAVASGTASGPIAVAIGQTTITTVVTAQNRATTHTYSITITRISNNALLSAIKLTPASSLTNTGTTGTKTTYTTSVPNAIASVTVTPTTQDVTATVKVNGVAVTSGTASTGIALAVGVNTITTIVTARDGTTTHTYSITITRAKSSNAFLSIIKLTPASALTNTGTAGSTTTYTTSVSNATTSVTVTPTTQDPTATVQVNGVAVTSGTPSGSIALFVGQNTINTLVTAQDGTTFRYTITVDRATGPIMSLYQPISVVQPTDKVNIETDGVTIRPGVSPNGDGINDFLTIDGIIAYPDNNLQIIDRNGTLIFQAKGYNNITKVFDGHSGINGRMQQPGTYFYSLDYVTDGQIKHKTGFILLKY